MKLHIEKKTIWDRKNRYYGRYKKHKVTISTEENGRFYYLTEGEKNYNSLWDNKKYDSIEVASKEAMRYIDGGVV